MAKEDLTEKVKLMEVELKTKLVELKTLQSKVNIAIDYEEELENRRIIAISKTKELRNDFFIKSGEITTLLHNMKNVFNIWTGNFYKDFL